MKSSILGKQICPECGNEITPSITPPCPSQGYYDGYADCPKCGEILYAIDGEDFADEETK